MYALYSMGPTRVTGLSFSNNTEFNDECLKQLVDIMPELRLLRTLDLSRIGATDQSLMRLIENLPTTLRELSLAGTPLSYFCFNSLT
jgi:hypothetical protein